MREFIDVTGKNEDEAIQKALTRLALDRDSVSVEVLERARKGFLGVGSSPAKIRVYYGPELEEKASAPVVTEEKTKAAKEPKKTAEKEPVSAPETAEISTSAEVESEEEHRPTVKELMNEPIRPVHAREERAERSGEGRRRRRRKGNKGEGESTSVSKTAPALVTEDLGEEIHDEKSDEIRAFLSGLLDHMGYSAIVRVYQTEKGRYKVILDGQGLGGLSGRRGETLDAMQQLTGYAVNRSGSRVRVQLDAEHYRAKREAALCQLARKTADKVVAGHRSFTLEPMNAYERHVIHMALQDVPNVSTHSTGIDPNRRVVVTYTRDEES